MTGRFAFQRINHQQNILVAPAPDVASGWLSTQVKLFQFDRTNLTVVASLLPALSDPGRVRFNLNASYYVELWENLRFNITFYGSWDSQPPPGFAGSDYGTSTGLNRTFGNR